MHKSRQNITVKPRPCASWLFLACVLFWQGCETAERICKQGTFRTCVCLNGNLANQACSKDGMGWGKCEGCESNTMVIKKPAFDEYAITAALCEKAKSEPASSFQFPALVRNVFCSPATRTNPKIPGRTKSIVVPPEYIEENKKSVAIVRELATSAQREVAVCQRELGGKLKLGQPPKMTSKEALDACAGVTKLVADTAPRLWGHSRDGDQVLWGIGRVTDDVKALALSIETGSKQESAVAHLIDALPQAKFFAEKMTQVEYVPPAYSPVKLDAIKRTASRQLKSDLREISKLDDELGRYALVQTGGVHKVRKWALLHFGTIHERRHVLRVQTWQEAIKTPQGAPFGPYLKACEDYIATYQKAAQEFLAGNVGEKRREEWTDAIESAKELWSEAYEKVCQSFGLDPEKM